MSQKKKASPSQEDLNAMSSRRRQEVLEQQKSKKRARIYIIAGIIVAVLVAALLVWDSGVIQRNATAYQVDGYNFSVADANYYFYSEYSNIMNYASYYGLDTSISLKDQQFSDGQTWYDYVLGTAEDRMNDVAVLCSAAKAEGFKLSDEGKADVESSIDSAKQSAALYGYDINTFLSYNYGQYMNLSAFRAALTEQTLASEYAAHLADSYEIADAELNAYYDENAATLDSFDYDAYTIYLGLSTEYDEEGNPVDYDPDVLAQAELTLAENSEKLQNALQNGSDEEIAAVAEDVGATALNGLSGSTLAYYDFGEWLADSSRTAGDVTTVSHNNTDSTGAEYVSYNYIVRFNGRSLDDYHGVDFYNLLVQAQPIEGEEGSETVYDKDAALASAQALMDEWKAGSGDAESFLAMADEHTDGSTTSYTNVAKGSQNEEVDAWLFDTQHTAGDTDIIWDETLHGYRLIYFTGYQDLAYWQTVAKGAISNQRYSDWLAQAEENLTTSETSFIKQVGE